MRTADRRQTVTRRRTERRQRMVSAWYDYGRQAWVELMPSPIDPRQRVPLVAACAHRVPTLGCHACSHAGDNAERRGR